MVVQALQSSTYSASSSSCCTIIQSACFFFCFFFKLVTLISLHGRLFRIRNTHAWQNTDKIEQDQVWCKVAISLTVLTVHADTLCLNKSRENDYALCTHTTRTERVTKTFTKDMLIFYVEGTDRIFFKKSYTRLPVPSYTRSVLMYFRYWSTYKNKNKNPWSLGHVIWTAQKEQILMQPGLCHWRDDYLISVILNI